MNIYTLYLESIAQGGEALGRINGKPVFVEGGAPDETVCCRTVEEHKTWARAELLEIITPSPERIDSSCAFYGKCGGCNLQHINYDAQIALKAAILKDALCRIGGLSPVEIEIVPSQPWEYRNRMQFHCLRQNVQNSRNYGFKGRRSDEIIPVSDCPVAVSGIREFIKNKKWIPLPPEKDRFTVYSKNSTFLSDGGELIPGVVERAKITLLENELFLDAGVFFQSNIAMLEKLILELKKTAENAQRNLPMADLYCGAGTFAIFLGGLFPKVILAEENKKAINIARENLKGADAEFFALRDTDWPDALMRRRDFGFAVADPPRGGMASKLASAFAHNGPPLLAYVSCDAPSLARDAKILINGGYKLKKLTFFDFYPQTAHIESLAVFEKQGI